MTQAEAIEEADEILRDEANELACLQTCPEWKTLSHRARVAIRRETQRLRQIAEALKGINDAH